MSLEKPERPEEVQGFEHPSFCFPLLRKTVFASAPVARAAVAKLTMSNHEPNDRTKIPETAWPSAQAAFDDCARFASSTNDTQSQPKAKRERSAYVFEKPLCLRLVCLALLHALHNV